MKCEICLCPISKEYNCNLCTLIMCSSQCTLTHFTQSHSNPSNSIPHPSMIPHKIFRSSTIQTKRQPSLIKPGTFLQIVKYNPQYSLTNLTPVQSKGIPLILGKGTFGQVHLVKHNLTDALYAIKHMSKDRLMSTLDSLSTIYNEIDIHSRLVHDNIIKILYVNETSKAFDLVMEYANGGTLFSLIKRRGGLSERMAHKYFMQVANAINFLHENNIIHRDLKPENILLDNKDNDKAKLCDFGWSIELSTRNRSTYCGTMEYMAPEIVNRGNYDKAIDTWSLGVLLYELIHGYSPFRAIYNSNDNNEVVRNIKSKHFKFDKVISNECKSLINELLNEDPAKRLKCAEIFSHPFALKYPIERDGDDNNNDKGVQGNNAYPQPVIKKNYRQKSISINNKEWVKQQLNNSSSTNNTNEELNSNNNSNGNNSNEINQMKAKIKKQKSIEISQAKERISRISIVDNKDSINCFEDVLAYSNSKSSSRLIQNKESNKITTTNNKIAIESLLTELIEEPPIKKPSNKIIKVFDMKTQIKAKEKKKIQQEQQQPQEQLPTVEYLNTNNASIISSNFLKKLSHSSLDMTKRGLSDAINLINKGHQKQTEHEFPQSILSQL